MKHGIPVEAWHERLRRAVLWPEWSSTRSSRDLIRWQRLHETARAFPRCLDDESVATGATQSPALARLNRTAAARAVRAGDEVCRALAAWEQSLRRKMGNRDYVYRMHRVCT